MKPYYHVNFWAFWIYLCLDLGLRFEVWGFGFGVGLCLGFGVGLCLGLGLGLGLGLCMGFKKAIFGFRCMQVFEVLKGRGRGRVYDCNEMYKT